jgi:hypothetical protein
MFCIEHVDSVHGESEVGALGSVKTCAQVLEGYNGVWSNKSWRW